jgi:hypothetical protein
MSGTLTTNAADHTGRQEQVIDFQHRILKLRWIGQEDEAERLLRAARSKDTSELVCPIEADTD